jgi:GDSL-like Lipase/Acylhydrolase family
MTDIDQTVTDTDRVVSVAPVEAASPQAGSPHEWEAIDVIILGIGVLVAAIVVFMAALAIPPLSGTRIISALIVLVLVAANLALGTLLVGAYIETVHQDWSRFGIFEHIVLAIAIIAVGAADGLFTWWIFSSTGSWVRWGYLALAGVFLVAGGLWSWHQLWPRRDTPAKKLGPWRLFSMLSGLLGVAFGIAGSAILLISSAISVNADVPAAAPPPVVHGISGRYVAIGDSYSAGEGLTPFMAGTAATNCDRSVSQAYSELLKFSSATVTKTFVACSGAIEHDIFNPTIRNGITVHPQVSGTVQPDVGLVTLTMGGNNALFSKIVIACFEESNCLRQTFPPSGVQAVEPVPPGPLATDWGPATLLAIGKEDATVFPALRHDYPNARIVVIGYPYLFPTGSAPIWPLDCFSVLRRFSEPVRNGIRNLQQQFSDLTYEEAVAAHIEFVSPATMWQGHEPCGSNGQYTNSIKPYLSFSSPVNGGTFHPNSAGQTTLARVVACYLNANPTPPDPFTHSAAGSTIVVPTTELVSPASLGLTAIPGSAPIPGCT